MNVKQPFGRASEHIMQSQGADTDVLKFYCTSYSTTHGAPCGRVERRVRTVGDWDRLYKESGFVNNARPYIPFRGEMDEHDNPPMRSARTFYNSTLLVLYYTLY